MLALLKKVSLGGYIAAAGAVLGLVALIVAFVSCAPNNFDFWFVQMPTIIVFTILELVLVGGALFYATKKGDGVISTVAVLGAVVLLVFCLIQMVEGKQDVLGTVMFSDLEKGYAPAETACYVGFTSMIIFAISAVVVIVGSFFGLAKKEEAQAQ